MIRERSLSSFKQYIDLVFSDKSGKEMSLLLNKLTTNHSYFLREQDHFKFLLDTILPQRISNPANREFNIWSAGCSAGQEAYTTAIAIDEFLGVKRGALNVKILATDISMNILEKAKSGTYTIDQLKEVPPHWITKYFKKIDATTFQVCDAIRKQVVFKPLNLMESFYFQKPFDLVMCRNVMIYFDKHTKDTLINKFYQVTQPKGFLFIGHSETIDKALTKYQYIKPAIYQR